MEILLRNPDYLEKLTNHKRLAEFKSRQQLTTEAAEVAAQHTKLEAKLEQPLEVTGTLRLDPASADRLARAAEAKD